jgi:hypothetical protein
MRLIDADELWRDFLKTHRTDFPRIDIKRVIDEALIIDPVKHGKWIMRGGKFRCSECDEKALKKDIGGTGGFSYEYEQVKSNYCPYCGAKMDK